VSELKVGDVVALRIPCLQNEVGVLGVVYYDYGMGIQVVFENGEYDGFSNDEQERFLNYVTHNEMCEDYHFTNVIKLSRDFRDGRFNSVWLSK
jgi:hypothetical protein